KAKAVIDAMVVAIKAGVEPGDIGIVVPYSGHKAQKEESQYNELRKCYSLIIACLMKTSGESVSIQWMLSRETRESLFSSAQSNPIGTAILNSLEIPGL
ncbi:hypothetical protein Pmar_PMAR014056, partial [Perkinsus marinus ATCC 50983]